MVARVLRLIVNSLVMSLLVANRDPVGDGIFASLTRDTSGSRLPANTFLKSSVEGCSGSAATSHSSPAKVELWGQLESQL